MFNIFYDLIIVCWKSTSYDIIRPDLNETSAWLATWRGGGEGNFAVKFCRAHEKIRAKRTAIETMKIYVQNNI